MVGVMGRSVKRGREGWMKEEYSFVGQREEKMKWRKGLNRELGEENERQGQKSRNGKKF